MLQEQSLFEKHKVVCNAMWLSKQTDHQKGIHQKIQENTRKMKKTTQRCSKAEGQA